MTSIFRIATVLFLSLLPLPALALGPMYSQHDLVAGEGTAGLEDGPFYSALFRVPLGMVVEAATNRIYLAERDNHTIRVVELSKSNQVWTLAGNGKAGYADGPLEKALFDKPTGLVFLPGRRIAVNDGGNARIRLVDLKARTVTTLAGMGQYGSEDGPALAAKVGPIWNMAYLAKQDALYFSQPDSGALRKLDLKTGEVLTVLKDDIRLPHPAALCASQTSLFTADRLGQDVFELSIAAPVTEATPGLTPTPTVPDFVWTHLGATQKVLALALSGEALYALENNPSTPVVMMKPAVRVVDLFSAWGGVIENPGAMALFNDVTTSLPIALAADPFCEKKLLMVHPVLNIVTSFRDMGPAPLTNNEMSNSNGLMDFDYPKAKPANVYRILLVGDSHVYHNYHGGTFTQNRMELMAKRLELALNSTAALQDSLQRFEVLTQARPSHDPLNVWPYYVVPDIVEKFDVDRVLLLQTSTDRSVAIYNTYFGRPLTGEGIPAEKVDPEYVQKPIQERTAQGPAKEFLDLCQARKLATISPNGQVQPAGLNELTLDSPVRAFLAKMYCRPLVMLKAKLAAARTSRGVPVVFEPLLVPVGRFHSFAAQKPFWEDVEKEIGPPFLDLTDLMTAFRVSYYPLSPMDNEDHFDEKGHLLIALSLARELVRRQEVPLSASPAPPLPKKAKPAAVLGTKSPAR